MYTAVIPVRKGSRRLVNKNIHPFEGSTLLEYKIDQLKKVSDITNIVVSSDCELMLSMAKKKKYKLTEEVLNFVMKLASHSVRLLNIYAII